MRHIPNGATIDQPVLSFRDALRTVGPDQYDRDLWLYVPDFYTEYRYLLGTRGKRPLICIGVNPSTAKPGELDRTLQSVDRVSQFNGFDSFIMLNVYAQRATAPEDMEKVLNPFLHRENLEAFRYALEQCENPVLWAAWGTVITMRPYLKDCVLDMIRVGQDYNARWVTVGTRSKAGHPHHPLYLRTDAPMEDFDVVGYCGMLENERTRR